MLGDKSRMMQTSIPIIVCPACGQHMFLCTIEPDDRLGERMTFVCNCGFEYRQAAIVSAERML